MLHSDWPCLSSPHQSSSSSYLSSSVSQSFLPSSSFFGFFDEDVEDISQVAGRFSHLLQVSAVPHHPFAANLHPEPHFSFFSLLGRCSRISESEPVDGSEFAQKT